jgi:hypothetical protein
MRALVAEPKRGLEEKLDQKKPARDSSKEKL